MLYACFYIIFLVFRYTSWHFYAISGTNLLTRCHSVSSLFSAVFVFQKSYTGNILRIERNKFQKSYFSRTKDEDQTRAGGGPGSALTPGWRGPGPGRAPYVGGGPGSPLTMPLHLYKALGRKTLGVRQFSRNSSVAPPPPPTNFGGQKSLFWHPAGMGKCPQSHLHWSPSPSLPCPSTSPPSPSTLLSPMMRRE
jgi:hypothetical protein